VTKRRDSHLRAVQPSGHEPPAPTPEPPLYPRRAEPVTYRLHVQLQGIRPPIWRLFEVPSDLPLGALHGCIQAVMGWEDAHLHGFARRDYDTDEPGARFVMDDLDDGPPGIPERTVRLDELLATSGDELAYLYDFGDSWTHLIRLDAVLPWDWSEAASALTAVLPMRVLDGARACPPEDCGGVPGYDGLRDTAATLARGKPVDDESAEGIAYYFPGLTPAAVVESLEDFDAEGLQAALDAAATAMADLPSALRERLAPLSTPEPLLDLISDVAFAAPPGPPSDDDVARAVEPFAWFLRHVGRDGLPLTSSGFLKPADVAAVAAHLDLEREWPGKHNREANSPPVLEFRRALIQLRLLRAAKGRLTATERGVGLVDDPRALWRHIVDRLPLGRTDADRDASLVVLLRAAGGGISWEDELGNLRAVPPDVVGPEASLEPDDGPARAPGAAFGLVRPTSSDAFGDDMLDELDDELFDDEDDDLGVGPDSANLLPYLGSDPMLALGYAALGWGDQDGDVVPSSEVRNLAATADAVLRRLGGYKAGRFGWSFETTDVGRALAREALGFATD
jgi:Plasmid pRiA4b ORF-3-like protein